MGGKIIQIDEYRWQVPQDYKPGMRVPGLIYADKRLFAEIESDPSVEQVANAAFLPGIVKVSLAMPDIHAGYGLPIGGVVATDIEEGVISPGGVGYDINCGVRLLRTQLSRKEIAPKVKELVNALFAQVPTGVGSKGKIRFSREDEKAVLRKGARWAIEAGYGQPEDLLHTEAGGCLEGADPEVISQKAYERGRPQQGTLGSGNHFLEIQYVQEIYDEKVASAFGLFPDQVTVMIHSGSRGFGHQVCTDYLVEMEAAALFAVASFRKI
ncbi:MAG: RtcB family protein, partial [candidate division NC10 bacterium]|nr:RtcB family protein [candidate division NC10 bacterium]